MKARDVLIEAKARLIAFHDDHPQVFAVVCGFLLGFVVGKL